MQIFQLFLVYLYDITIFYDTLHKNKELHVCITSIKYPNEILTTPTKEVSSFGKLQIINDMVETHYAQTNCAALAANQLGFDQRITVIDFSENKNDLLILVNPYIVDK